MSELNNNGTTTPRLLLALTASRSSTRPGRRAAAPATRRPDRDPEHGAEPLCGHRHPAGPDGDQTYRWVQTTTLEGGHDHDIWSQEGATGFDTEQTKGAEPCRRCSSDSSARRPSRSRAATSPPVRSRAPSSRCPTSAASTASGRPRATPVPSSPARSSSPWVALSDLNNGDQQIYVGRGNADGTFDIKNVPDGSLPGDDLGRRPGLHHLQRQCRRWRTVRSPTSGTSPWSAGSPTSTARSSSTRTATARWTRARTRSRSSP